MACIKTLILDRLREIQKKSSTVSLIATPTPSIKYGIPRIHNRMLTFDSKHRQENNVNLEFR
jgi:hypothetical protein